MLITFLGHAGFFVQTEQTIVVMDPWLSPRGAFDSSWFQFPKNHHLADLVQSGLADDRREKYVYISHEHQDHFDLEFLESLRSRDFTLVVPRYRKPSLRRLLAGYRCKEIVAVADGESLVTEDAQITVFVDDSELNRDSAVLVASREARFLNLNDCRIFDRLEELADTCGPIDAFACQFSGASWHPTCYVYDDARFAQIGDAKAAGKFGAIARAIDVLQPSIFLASAGPACFLDPELLALNGRPGNIFRQPPELLAYLAPVLGRNKTEGPLLMPGDVIDAVTSNIVAPAPDRLDYDDLPSYIATYAATYADFFAARRAEQRCVDRAATWSSLKEELERKLALLTLRERIKLPLYFGSIDESDGTLRVDFTRGVVEFARAPAESEYYRIDSPSWQIRKVLDGTLTWEQFGLTFRVRLQRVPDLYQPLIHAFMTMGAGDLVRFCRMIVELESREERISIDTPDGTYSVARWCPHNGADLAAATIEGTCFLVCPRHKWRFDLSLKGVCTTNPSTVRAILTTSALERDELKV